MAYRRITSQYTTYMGKELNYYESLEKYGKGSPGRNFVYGEMNFESFAKVFKWIQKEWKDKDPDCWHNAFNAPGGTFIDLGHGMGKGILAAALTH